MLYISVWILTALCSFCLADEDMGHHHMFPLSPIKRGSSLELFCSLGKKLYPLKNANNIIWTLNGNRVAKENYIIVNDSVSGVVIHNFTYGEAQVNCYVDFQGKMQLLVHAEIKSGFPPQIPENISCIHYEYLNITCSWSFEQDTYIETNYTLILKPKNASYALYYNWQSKNGSRSYHFKTDIFYPKFCIQLKLKNSLGEAESQCVDLESEKIMKIKPPSVEVNNIRGMKKMLNVSWEVNMNEVKCRIRYRNMKLNESNETTYNFIEISQQESLNLTNLWSYTDYAVAIQCKMYKSRFWSDWSEEQIGKTEQEAPVKEVDLWRILEKCPQNGYQQVHLLWKQLKDNESLGPIIGYRIKCFTQSNYSVDCPENTTHELVNVSLPADQASVVRVIAYNSAGNSPEAVLRIPSCAEEREDHPRVVMLNASAVNEQMVVEWKSSHSEPDSYVVEWYDVSKMGVHERSWQYVRNTTKLTFQKGVFEPYKCYIISVYPVCKDEIKAPSSTRTYFKQGRPSVGPNARVENINKNEATIKWNELEKGQANGDIIGYTIIYRPKGGKDIKTTVNASLLQYRLTSLQANTQYTVHVKASTIAGGTIGNPIDFTTLSLSQGELVLINIFAVLLILCLLTVGLLWALKRNKLKRIFWPKIPHPKLPEMSQDNLQEKPLKEPESEEKTVIPEVVSVLKIDDNAECQQLKLEDCLGETKAATEDVIGQAEASGNGEPEAMKLLLQTAPSLGQHLRNPLLPAYVIQQPPLQKPEESLSEDYQNSDCKDKERHDQANTKEKTESNPYLKNSVRTREFLVCENLLVSKKKERNGQTVLAPICVSSDNGQQYMALDAVVMTKD